MIKVIISGAKGKMGRYIAELIKTGRYEGGSRCRYIK